MKNKVIGIWFKPLMWLKKASGLLRACFICPHVLTLAFLLMSVWVVGASFACYRLHEPNWGQWSLSHLFDLSATIDALNTTSSIVGKVVAVMLYGTTWLIGGGILLGILIDNSREYFSKIREGHLRYWWALRNHLVILGWEPNAISLIRDLTNNGKPIPFWYFNRILRRHRIVIISELPAEEIRQQIEESIGRGFGRCRPFSFIIYNGRYDNKTEFKKLALRHARKIYVTGEETDDSHDTRALLFLAEFDQYLNSKKGVGNAEKIHCHVRIASFSLFRLLILTINNNVEEEHKYGHLDVWFFSFYENWAKVILPIDENADSAYPDLVSFEGNPPPARLIVVGFGKMGQAITIEAFRSHKRRDNQMLNVTVVDPNIDEYKNQFAMSHDHIKTRDYANYAQLTYASSMCVEDDAFSKMVDSYMDNNEKITIALTYEMSDDAIVRAVALAKRYKTANILVRLNIDTLDAKVSKKVLAESYKLSRLFPFGFRSGAGYGEKSTYL